MVDGPVVRWVSTLAPWAGKAQVSIDGGTPVVVDLYSPVTLYQRSVFERSDLGAGIHTVAITAIAKNPLATASWVEFDAIEAVGLVPVKRLEESAAGVVFSSGWVSSLSAAARSGGAASTTSSQGRSVSFMVEGPVVRWVSTLAPWAGKAEVVIDGGTPTVVDLYSPFTLYQRTVFERSDLGAGIHTVTITAIAKNPLATASWVEFDAIEAVGLVPVKRFEESSTGLVFSSGWVSSLSASARSGGAALTTSSQGRSVSFMVDGPVVRWVSTLAPWAGKAEVVIDGGTPTVVDLYSPFTLYQRVAFERSDLSVGTHTVTITTVAKNALATASWVEFDAIEAVELVAL